MLVKESLDSFVKSQDVNEGRDASGKRPRISGSFVGKANTEGGFERNAMHTPKPDFSEKTLKKRPMQDRRVLDKYELGGEKDADMNVRDNSELANPKDRIVVKWEAVLGRPLTKYEVMALTVPKEEQRNLGITDQVEIRDAYQRLISEKRNKDMMNKIKQDPRGYRDQLK